MQSTIDQLLKSQYAKQTDAPFLIFPERSETVSYAQLLSAVTQVAGLLKRLGVSHGQKVALLLPNIPEFVYFYWGAMSIGAVACPINTLLKGAEIEYITNHCEAVVFVTTPEFLPVIQSVADNFEHVKNIILIPDTIVPSGDTAISLPITAFRMHQLTAEYPNLELSSLQSQPVLPDDDAMIIYTSGTTGKPKGVVLTHHNLITDARYITEWFGFSSQTRFMNILPLFHVNGEVVTLMTPLFCGGSVVLNRKFSASNFWPYIAQYQVNIFSTVPTILSLLLNHPKPSEDITSLQFGICGAAPLPVEVHKQFEATFNIPIYEGYGLSETTCYSSFNPPDTSKRKIGSIGVAVGNDMSIWDENNNPMPVGEGGEIVVRGENVMKQYFKNPEATEKAFAGGWFHTGDFGKQDEEGFFFILDRVKDMIIRGGENIYPREIDEVLYEHPAVSAAATIGIPDAKYGEVVKSYVVLNEGQNATAEELILYCRERLANYKCPEHIAFIAEIPKGPTGKLLRRALRDLES